MKIGTAITKIKKYANYWNKSSEMSLFAYLKESVPDSLLHPAAVAVSAE